MIHYFSEIVISSTYSVEFYPRDYIKSRDCEVKNDIFLPHT